MSLVENVIILKTIHDIIILDHTAKEVVRYYGSDVMTYSFSFKCVSLSPYLYNEASHLGVNGL